MSKQVIVDYIPFEVSPQQINESINENNGRLVVKGVLQRAEAKNQNGRVYPKETLMREAEKYADEFIREKRALGELDHPDSSIINLANVSHMVTDIWMDDMTVMGKCKVLDTPAGQILRSLVDAGVKIGISSRGMGSVREQMGQTIVEDDFQLICFDIVSEPSTPGAFMALSESQLMNEQVVKNNKVLNLINSILED